MSKDDRIHGEMRVEYALIPAAFAIVVYDVFAPMGNNISSPGDDVVPGLPTRGEQHSRVLRIQKSSKEEKE